jgi:Winged helix-turn helix
MPNFPTAPLPIPADDLRVLCRWVQASSVPAGLAQRAKLLLLAAEGSTNTAIAEQLGITRPTVIAWRRRDDREGLAGVADRPRPAAPGRFAATGAPRSWPPRSPRLPNSLASRIGPVGCWLLSWGQSQHHRSGVGRARR